MSYQIELMWWNNYNYLCSTGAFGARSTRPFKSDFQRRHFAEGQRSRTCWVCGPLGRPSGARRVNEVRMSRSKELWCTSLRSALRNDCVGLSQVPFGSGPVPAKLGLAHLAKPRASPAHSVQGAAGGSRSALQSQLSLNNILNINNPNCSIIILILFSNS